MWNLTSATTQRNWKASESNVLLSLISRWNARCALYDENLVVSFALYDENLVVIFSDYCCCYFNTARHPQLLIKANILAAQNILA